MLMTTNSLSHETALPLSDPRTIRVAVFSDCFPERNGAGSYYHDLTMQLRPEVGTLEMFQPTAKRKRMLNLAFPLPGDSTQKLITPNLFRLQKQFEAMCPHLIISVTPGPFGLLGLYFARQYGTGFITAFHTHFEDVVPLYGKLFFPRAGICYLSWVNKLLFKYSDTVLVNNKSLASTVRSLGAKRVDIMGTPLAHIFLNRPLAPPRNRLEQVLFAGRLAPEKNLQAIIEAVKAFPEIKFTMAGDGPLRGDMEMVSRQYHNLRLTGWIERKALCTEIDSADLLLLPSRMETFGTVALEAMARGRPALVTENAGIHQWPILQSALFKLSQDSSLIASLKEISVLSESTWKEKARAARIAAKTLNSQTISQWVNLIGRYGRCPV